LPLDILTVFSSGHDLGRRIKLIDCGNLFLHRHWQSVQNRDKLQKENNVMSIV
jgi:hypothetical protein